MIDYRTIIENLDCDAVINLMTKLGADRYREERTYIIFPTICHNECAEDASLKLYYYKDSKRFVCYTQCDSMTIFDFLCHYYETREINYDWVRDVVEVARTCSPFGELDGFQPPKYERLTDRFGRINRKVNLPVYDEKVLDVFSDYHPPEWVEEGITDSAMDKFGIKFSVPQNKIIIPHRDINGNLVGIRGRALDPWEVENLGKYMPVQIEQTWYKHPLSMNLYGLYENQANILKSGVCWVFEAEKSVLMCEGYYPNSCALAVCGSSLNKAQLNLIMEYCAPREIIICFDNEEQKGKQVYFDKLYHMCKKYKNYTNFSFIYDREGLTAAKDSPIDKGPEVFEELLRKRFIMK